MASIAGSKDGMEDIMKEYLINRARARARARTKNKKIQSKFKEFNLDYNSIKNKMPEFAHQVWKRKNLLYLCADIEEKIGVIIENSSFVTFGYAQQYAVTVRASRNGIQQSNFYTCGHPLTEIKPELFFDEAKITNVSDNKFNVELKSSHSKDPNYAHVNCYDF